MLAIAPVLSLAFASVPQKLAGVRATGPVEIKDKCFDIEDVGANPASLELRNELFARAGDELPFSPEDIQGCADVVRLGMCGSEMIEIACCASCSAPGLDGRQKYVFPFAFSLIAKAAGAGSAGALASYHAYWAWVGAALGMGKTAAVTTAQVAHAVANAPAACAISGTGGCVSVVGATAGPVVQRTIATIQDNIG